MNRRKPRRFRSGIRRAVVGLVVVGGVFLFTKWRDATNHGGQQPAEPFRIAGNLYYVGANDVTSFLVTGPDGHVLIDGGYPETPSLIIESIAKLGFDIRDVRILLNSEPHFDHAGGLAALQEASGAQLWVSDASAEAILSGGATAAHFFPLKLLIKAGIARYPAARVDHRLQHGDTVRLGPIELVAHITAGHTEGCTTWSLVVEEGDRHLNVVHACSLTVLPGMRFVEPERYPGITADFERSFHALRDLPVDIWVTSHARRWGRYPKYVESTEANGSVEPFIDPEGYRTYIDDGEAWFRQALAEQHP